jgi:hypothetical protein
LIIRRAQIDVFEDARPEFENQLIRHLQEFSPLHSELSGEQGVRPIVRGAVERAANYSWTRRGPVQLFVDLIFLLGVVFDTDPQYPWITKILVRSTIDTQVAEADEMHAQVIVYLDATGGPGREYAKRALRRAREMSYEGPPIASPRYFVEALHRARGAYPEKYDYLGVDLVSKVIEGGLIEARRYSVTSDAGVALFASLMFALGYGVLRDPKYPFIESTLTNPAISEPNRRAERVYSKMMTYLDRVLERAG